MTVNFPDKTNVFQLVCQVIVVIIYASFIQMCRIYILTAKSTSKIKFIASIRQTSD